MILILRKEKFGPSSEKTPKQVDGQLSLFNEAELEADASILEPIKKEVKGYVRTDSRKKREELIKDLPVREILCEAAPEDLYCGQCNTELKPLGKEVVREDWNIFQRNYKSCVMSEWLMNVQSANIPNVLLLKRP